MEHNIQDILKNLNDIQHKLANGIQNNDNRQGLNTLFDVLGEPPPDQEECSSVEKTGDMQWKKSVENSLEYLIELIENPDKEIRTSASAILTQLGEQIIECVSPALNSESKNKRLFAVNMVGKIKSESSLPLLYDLMKRETEDVVLDAIYEALGLIGNKKSIPFLLEHLNKTKNMPWRQFPIVYALMKIADESIIEVMLQLILNEVLNPLAIECLGTIGDPSVIIPLFELLVKEKNNFKKLLSILTALQKIEHSTLEIQQYQKDETIFDFIADKFAALDDPEIPKIIIDNIEKQCFDDQLTLLWALKRIKKHYDPVLVFERISLNDDEKFTQELLDVFSSCETDMTDFFMEILIKGSADQRIFAMKYLMFNCDERVVPILCELTSSPNPKVRIQAAKGLGISLDPKAMDPLIKLLEDENPEVVEAAIGAIAINGNLELIEKIRPIIKSGNNIMKKNIIAVIGIIDNAEFLPEVLECIDDPSPLVRAESAKVAGIIGTHADLAQFPGLQDKLKKLVSDESISVRKEIIKTISILYGENKETVEFLDSLQCENDIWTKYYALQELAKYKKKAVLPYVINNIRENLPISVLTGYCRLIGEISDGEGLKDLIEIIDFPDPELQSVIVQAMGKINDPSNLPLIIKKCYSNNFTVKTAAISALGCFSLKKVEDTLIKIIRELANHLYIDEFRYFEQVVCTAIESFGKSSSCKKIEVLMPFAKDERFMMPIFHALLNKKDLIFEHVGGFVKSKDPSIRRFIAIVLGEIKHSDSVKFLEKLIGDNYPSVRRTAIMALGKNSSPEALNILNSVELNGLPELEKYLAKNAIDFINKKNSKI